MRCTRNSCLYISIGHIQGRPIGVSGCWQPEVVALGRREVSLQLAKRTKTSSSLRATKPAGSSGVSETSLHTRAGIGLSNTSFAACCHRAISRVAFLSTPLTIL